MKKVIVAEIGKSTLVLNAFGDINSPNPKLLGQVVARTGLKEAIALLERDIGSLDQERVELYIVSSLKQSRVLQEILLKDKDESWFFKRDDINFRERSIEIVATEQAIGSLSEIFLEEVGEVLILDVGGGSTDIYLVRRNQSVRVGRGLGIYQDAISIVSEIGEDDIKIRYGSDWEMLVKPIPKTAEEIAFGRELAAVALQKALYDFCYLESSHTGTLDNGPDLSQLRWVIGTGGALNNLPNGLEMIREALAHCKAINLPEDGFPILLDRDNILASLGPLKHKYKDGIWQLLLESLGVES